MRLAGAITEGSGAVNEDGFGVIAEEGAVSAAWVFDGVTGINGRNYLPGGSDAAWLVGKADAWLRQLAGEDLPLDVILHRLVDGLIADWAAVARGLSLPANYDPPAACLVLVKRYGSTWQSLRLGDSCLLAEQDDDAHHIAASSPNNAFDHWLSGEARKRRDAGVLDIKALLAEFRPQLIASRARRNRPDGYSILEASAAALRMPEVSELGHPRGILLCTDGYYRAVDHYRLCDDRGLVAASSANGGVAEMLRRLRAVEAADPACETYLRFKPADDATAVMLSST